MRKPFQGVLNIVRFNWHFYVSAMCLMLLLISIASYFNPKFDSYLYIMCIVVATSMLISLLISHYVYDLSGLYGLHWLEAQNTENLVVNINAGFDETSALLENKFNQSKLIVLDFYNPLKHTEISIERARKAHPPFRGTKPTETNNLPLKDNSADKIFVIFAAHEIRNYNERTEFLKELHRVIKPTGEIFITEHLRDIANFAAYNIGFFHFYSKKNWLEIFRNAGLKIKNEIKITPFVSTFVLTKNGNTH